MHEYGRWSVKCIIIRMWVEPGHNKGKNDRLGPVIQKRGVVPHQGVLM